MRVNLSRRYAGDFVFARLSHHTLDNSRPFGKCNRSELLAHTTRSAHTYNNSVYTYNFIYVPLKKLTRVFSFSPCPHLGCMFRVCCCCCCCWCVFQRSGVRARVCVCCATFSDAAADAGAAVSLLLPRCCLMEMALCLLCFDIHSPRHMTHARPDRPTKHIVLRSHGPTATTTEELKKHRARARCTRRVAFEFHGYYTVNCRRP